MFTDPLFFALDLPNTALGKIQITGFQRANITSQMSPNRILESPLNRPVQRGKAFPTHSGRAAPGEHNGAHTALPHGAPPTSCSVFGLRPQGGILHALFGKAGNPLSVVTWLRDLLAYFARSHQPEGGTREQVQAPPQGGQLSPRRNLKSSLQHITFPLLVSVLCLSTSI